MTNDTRHHNNEVILSVYDDKMYVGDVNNANNHNHSDTCETFVCICVTGVSQFTP